MNSGGFPNCTPATSQIGNSLSKTSVITVEYCGPDRAFKNIIFFFFSSVIICLYPKECNQLISKKSIIIGIMCKLSFKDKSSISKKELESLGGLLSHCSHVVDGGRTHSRWIYDLYKVFLNNNLKRVKLGVAAREDLR